MFENFSFEYPYILMLILVFILLDKYSKLEVVSYYIANFYQNLPHADTKNYLKIILKWLIILSTVIALASPIVYTSIKTQESKSIDIVLSLDTSGSMAMTGFNPLNFEQSRWDIVQDVVKDFIHKRKNDRIGLVIFGTTAAIASPLTYSKDLQIDIVNSIKLGILGKSTALIDGLTTAISLLKESKTKSKVIILLSDGEDTSSIVPLNIALKFAKKYNIKIYTVAIDEGYSNMLKLISFNNKTKSFHATTKQDLYDIYRTIDNLERSSLDDKQIIIINYYTFYFIAFSLVCSFLLFLFRPIKELI